jgi:mannose-6-phosphate isomerase
VLAAEKPLSIQAHPDRRQAEEGFRREEAQGVPRDDGRRNYRDPNPKPECLWALEPFEGLCGFRSPPVILKHLEALCPAGLAPELGLFRERPDAGGLRRLFASLLGFAPDRCRSILKEALARRDRIDAEAGRWIARLHDSFDTGGPGSRPEIAILSPAWLEILKLAPGRLVFLPAGVLHSYLQGVGLEIMANSDNVVRGGLTDKNIDIAELMRILDFEREPPRIGAPVPVGPLEKRFQGPAAEFALSEIRVGPGELYAGRSARAVEIFLCTQGRALFLPPAADAPLLAIGRGESCLVPAATPGYRLSGPAVVYKATVGKEGGAAPAG